jgi:hypothetical protein
MKRLDYVEVCRRFVADQFHINLSEVETRRIANPLRGAPFSYQHRIDLYWKTEDRIASYVHVGRVCWRKGAGVGLDQVLALGKARDKLAAHKGVLFTNGGFTQAAVAAAEDDRIALFLVRPTQDVSRLSAIGEPGFARGVRFLRTGVYFHEVIR